jgi:hypothetical protein
MGEAFFGPEVGGKPRHYGALAVRSDASRVLVKLTNHGRGAYTAVDRVDQPKWLQFEESPAREPPCYGQSEAGGPRTHRPVAPPRFDSQSDSQSGLRLTSSAHADEP